MSTQTSQHDSLTYRSSGVDIDAGNSLVDRIKPSVKQTIRDGTLGGIGGFGALFEVPIDRYKQPVLVSGTDGVGTKLKLAGLLEDHSTIGIDLVAMCVNDIVVAGAEPLYFLDYFATSKLDVDQAEQVIKGIAQGCLQAGCTLAGGETAEMPGMYGDGEYDLAGFAVGVVEKSKILSSSKVGEGQALIGLRSSGPHSNGYSLIRKILERTGLPPETALGERSLGETLLTPTRIYVKSILKLLETIPVGAISHITGGGLTENLPRVLSENTIAEIDMDSWDFPIIFQWLQQQGNIETSEMLKTFNCGIGMVLILDQGYVEDATKILEDCGESVIKMGHIVSDPGPAQVRYITA